MLPQSDGRMLLSQGRMPQEERQDASLFGRQDAGIRLLAKTKTVCSNTSFSPILSIGLRSGSRETVHREKRETGLEPATACLEGRNSTN
jgi:hypothetical protein